MASCVRAFFLVALVTSAILGSRSVASTGEWYLIGSPNEADLDTSRHPDGSPAWDDYWTGLRTLESPEEARLKRCLTNFFVEEPAEPISHEYENIANLYRGDPCVCNCQFDVRMEYARMR
jgi:hypothetical protein